MDHPVPRETKSFYRSRLFWLGLPALAFLVWLCVACPPWLIAVERHDRAYGVAVGVDDGIRLISMEMKGAGFGNRVSFEAATNMERIPPGRPIRFTRAGSNKAFGFSRMDGVVAYSFVIPFYVALWLGALVTWQRRKIRLLKTSGTAPP